MDLFTAEISLDLDEPKDASMAGEEVPFTPPEGWMRSVRLG